MTPTLLVALPPNASDLADTVVDAGGTPVVDLTLAGSVRMPPGAWVRCHPSDVVPGNGPVILVDATAPVPDRDTWLETTDPSAVDEAVAAGFAGVVLRGSEAGGHGSRMDSLTALSRCTLPGRVILHGGLGPKTASAAMALGAAGVLVADAVLGCPELRLPPALAQRLDRPDDTLTTRVHGLRLANPVTAPVLRQLATGGDPWALARDIWATADLRACLWLAGTGLRHAQHNLRADISLVNLIGAYLDAMSSWKTRARSARCVPERDVHPSPLGTAVAWEYTDDPLSGGPLAAAIAVGGDVCASQEAFDAARDSLLGLTAPEPVPAEAIAIIGMGCRFPDAPDLATYWKNLSSSHSAIREIPSGRWDPSLYWDEDRDVPDKTYSKIGAFIDDETFSGKRFRIPPRVAEGMDPVQGIALDACWDALVDANLSTGTRGDEGREFDRSRCAVILGNSLGGETRDQSTLRVAYPAVERAVREGANGTDVTAILDSVARTMKGERTIDEDAMPGELSNVIAGRVANALDLGGANFTVDAACASSLAAIQAAIKGLQDGDFDLALTGGSDRSMAPATYVKFSKIGALSPDHSAPFDASANGFVMGEGAGILLLKRYSEAVADSDRIYAVIRGVGSSSDGRGKGITAPNIKGQLLALERAYAIAGITPGDVDLIEAHGTSTVVGDKVEVTALSQVIGADRDPARGPIRLGSVKSMIGHLKSAAGAASLIKTALAIHHKTYPPSLGFQNARADVPLGDTLQVQTRTEPWPTPPSGVRRAGVSAFGFGGTNFHVVLEEATGGPARPHVAPLPPAPAPMPQAPAAPPVAPSSSLPDGVWATSAPTKSALLDNVRALIDGRSAPFDATHTFRIAGGFTDDAMKADQLARARACLEKDSNPALLTSRGVFLESGPTPDRLAFLFPGQGNQYVGMGLDLAERYPTVAATLATADRVVTPVLGRTLTSLLANTDDDAQDVLTATEHAQPAVFALDVALLRLLAEFGITPDAVAGHSLGEYAAAVAAGVLTFEQGLHATSARGREMASIVLEDPGRMIGVQASPEKTDEVLAGVQGYAIAANRNCPTQTVVAGTTDGIAEAERAFSEHGIGTVPLSVSHAFHSAVVAPASEPFQRVLESLGPKAPTLPFTSNVGAVAYPSDPSDIARLMASQLASPVAWTDQIEGLYDQGFRTFIEVGPKRALSGFTRSILGKRPHHAIATNHPKRGGVATFLGALAALTALGLPVRQPGTATSTELAMSDVRRAATEAGASPADAAELSSAIYPALRDLMAAVVSARPAAAPQQGHVLPRVVCSGASVGLPGGDEVFAQDNIARILSGEGRIESLGERSDTFVGMNIVRLVKDGAGGAAFHPVTSRDDVIRLAGSKRHFDAADYGVPPELSRALDITSELAIAAAVEALRDAGIPLVETWRETSSGKRVPGGWRLPEALQTGTGVVFASAFPGYDQLLQHVQTDGLDADGRFDRRMLFQILSMGHSQLAQFIGAKGPNTQVNAACASTTQAVSIAHDWLRLGRCERVIVVGADDVTGDRLLPWIGGGFLAAGAATTAATAEEGALPFDARRHGMILGMGAVGLVLERQDLCAERGVQPIAELLGTRISNSAFHGTRLDGDHIAREMTALVDDVASLESTSATDIAAKAMFMSHETYTPARGGSASAEADALRAAFGPSAGKVAIANTKGFTGHPMGAGIEDAIALKALQYGTVPPIANLSEPDPEFRDLHLSRGEKREVTYAIRLAAGFGSQVALAMWRSVAKGDARIADAHKRAAWLHRITGYDAVSESISDRTLRVRESDSDHLMPIAPGAAPVPVAPASDPVAPASKPAAPASEPAAATVVPLSAPGGAPVARAQVLDTLVRVVAEQSGYQPEDLDPEFELEADLGIDTVKQAEVLSTLRERFQLGQDDAFRLSDHPTLDKLADYLTEQLALSGGSVPASAAPAASKGPAADAPKAPEPSAAPTRPVTATTASIDRGEVLQTLIAVVAERSGYAASDLDPEFELEADLGIDTVKQAEVLSELRERFQLGQDDSFRLADHPTLDALADYLTSQLAQSGEAPAPEAVVQAETINEAVITEGPAQPRVSAPRRSESAVYAILADVVATQTGYATEDLDPEFELEADLGIDTVKQAEIFSQVRERLGIEATDELRLADTPTLGGLAAALASHAVAATEPQLTAPSATPSPVADAHQAPPLRIGSAIAELPDFWIRQPVPVAQPLRAPSPVHDVRFDVIGDGDLVTALVTEMETRGATRSSDAPEWVFDVGTDVEQSLAAARTLASNPPRRWITRTAMGGIATRADADVAARDGARSGLTKALGREWEATSIRVVDLLGIEDAAAIATHLCDEAATDGPDEVSVTPDGRTSVQYALCDAPLATLPSEYAVVMVTGGARGIGLAIATELANRGCRLALVGRTEPGERPLDEAAEKERIRAELTEAGERITPVAIDRHLAPLRAREEVRKAIASVPGATYFSADLSDTESVEALVTRVTRDLGRIDAVVHGAGIEDSRPVQDKRPDALPRAMGAKVQGALALSRALDPNTRLVCMGSVAGRFGNAGQTDYAAANDALARLSTALPNALCVDWTAWADAGMATRGGMEHLLTQRGVELLPAAVGARLVADWVFSSETGERVVAGALGGFSHRTGHPMLSEVQFDGARVVATTTLDPSAAWLVDHSIDGTPVFAGVVGMEWMAVVAAELLGERPDRMEDVRFAAPLKVHPNAEPPKVTVQAALTQDGRAWCTLSSVRTLATGRVQETLHFSGIAAIGHSAQALPSAFLPDEVVSKAQIYRRFFHGPRFQVLDCIVGIAADGLVAQARLPRRTLIGADRTAPLAIEAGLQAAGMHRWAERGLSGLPHAIERMEILANPPEDSPLTVTVVATHDRYDVDIDSPDGPVARLRGLQLIDRGPVGDDDRLPTPDGGRPVCFAHHDTSSPPVGARASASASVSADLWLTPAERTLCTDRGTARRQNDRLLGRIAAKRALVALTGQPATSLRVTSDPSGAPVVLGANAQVSISHRSGRAVAVASYTERVGIDLEPIASRSDAFLADWFHADERAWVGDAPLAHTLVWSAKEAVLKLLGTGLTLHAPNVRVEQVDARALTVSLHGDVREHARRVGVGPICVQWRYDGVDHVVVTASAPLARSAGQHRAA